MYFNTSILNSLKIGVPYRPNPYSTLEEGKVCCKILATHISFILTGNKVKFGA